MATDDGFFNRWARRKADARQGKPLDELAPAEPPRPQPLVSQKAATPEALTIKPSPVETPEVAAPPPLTVEDANALTQHSDFKPFMAQQVQPEVRNAAMKKLFADPHYNVMDGLDTYIDDYSKSDPIPESMLRQMVSAQFLKLFDEETTEAITPPRDSTGVLPTESVAQSIDPTEPPLLAEHANTHLRLQQDHAAAGPDLGSRPA